MTVAPTVYLDECVDHNLVGALRKRGFSVTSVFDEDTVGLDDEFQLAYAASRDWVLVTHNGRHFAQLHRSGQVQERLERGYCPPGFTQEDPEIALGRAKG